MRQITDASRPIINRSSAFYIIARLTKATYHQGGSLFRQAV